jgi:hypothetical protein
MHLNDLRNVIRIDTRFDFTLFGQALFW